MNSYKTFRSGDYFFSGLYASMFKYLITAVLLFLATSQYNLLGFIFFLLFLYHSIAYYAFRISDKPIDMLLKQRRPFLYDARGPFSYLFLVFSALMFLLIVILKIMLAISGKDHSPFDSRTNSDIIENPDEKMTFLKIFALLIPTFDSLLTLFSTILALGLSIFYMISKNKEIKEEQARTLEA
jgi:hypothetical protein